MPDTLPKTVGIGGQVPDVTLPKVINYPKPALSISDFKGKLLILDFWATWCSPCVAMIPKMDSLQRKFDGQIQFLSVTDQSQETVSTFMKKFEEQRHAKYNVPSVVEDNKLLWLFPHNFLPHYVWIDPDGIVKAITEFEEVNEVNIRKALNGGDLSVHVKVDPEKVPYTHKKPFFINNNGGNGEGLLYSSMLARYTEGIGMGVAVIPDSLNTHIACRNQPLEWLYRIAYSERGLEFFNDNGSVLEVADKELLNTDKVGMECIDWCRQGNAYCYELIVPTAMKNLNPHKLMQEDLKRFFPQYTATIEDRRIHCLLLTRTSGVDKLASKSDKTSVEFDRFSWKIAKADLNLVAERLNALESYPLKVINDTGYKGVVDMQIAANFPDLKSVNKELEKYDLKFVEGYKTTRLLVIRDTKPAP